MQTRILVHSCPPGVEPPGYETTPVQTGYKSRIQPASFSSPGIDGRAEPEGRDARCKPGFPSIRARQAEPD